MKTGRIRAIAMWIIGAISVLTLLSCVRIGTTTPSMNDKFSKSAADKYTDTSATSDQAEALMRAVVQNDLEAAKLLIEKGANPSTGTGAVTPLATAIARGNPETFELFSAKQINTTEWSTAVNNAGKAESLEMMTLLLEKGADPNTKFKGGMTALMMAVALADMEAVRLLLEKGADANTSLDNGEPVLILAASTGNVEMVRLLVDRGAKINAADLKGRTPLWWAEHRGQTEMSQYLKSRGATTPTSAKSDRVEALVSAVARNDLEAAKLLIEKGANPSTTDGIVTPLTMAIAQRNPETMRLLAEKETNATKWSTAVKSAGKGTNIEMLTLLLEKGADPNTKLGDGMTALMMAVGTADLEVVRLLLEKGADANTRLDKGGPVLTVAASAGNLEMARLLLDRGARINAVDLEGKTALWWAENRGQAEMTQYLKSRGAR